MRCPHCGKPNYGNVTKCFSCGQEMTTASGAALVSNKEKKSNVKAQKRIKIPALMITGVVIFILGFITLVFPFFLCTATPDDFERNSLGYNQEQYFIFFRIFEGEPDDTREVWGQITMKERFGTYYVYELDGEKTRGYFKDLNGQDLVGARTYTDFAVSCRDDPDMTFISDIDLGDMDDYIHIEVIVKADLETQTIRWLEYHDNPLLFKYFVAGPLVMMLSALIFFLGWVGKKDTSMEEYLKAHPELQKGEMSLSEYQEMVKQQDLAKSQQQQDLYNKGPGAPPPGQPGMAPQGPPPGQPGMAPQGPPPGQPGMAPQGPPPRQPGMAPQGPPPRQPGMAPQGPPPGQPTGQQPPPQQGGLQPPPSL